MAETCRHCQFCVDIVEVDKDIPHAMGWCYGLPPVSAGPNQSVDVPVRVDVRFCSLFKPRKTPPSSTRKGPRK